MIKRDNYGWRELMILYGMWVLFIDTLRSFLNPSIQLYRCGECSLVLREGKTPCPRCLTEIYWDKDEVSKIAKTNKLKIVGEKFEAHFNNIEKLSERDFLTILKGVIDGLTYSGPCGRERFHKLPKRLQKIAEVRDDG